MNINLTFGRKSGEVGGGRPVFDQRFRQSRMADGALIDNPPALGGIIFAGDIAQYDSTTCTCKHLKVFKIAKAVGASDTAILVYRGNFSHVLDAGLVLMAAPATLTTTGAAVTVGTVTETTDVTAGDVYSFAITANALGELAKDSLLVEANSAGASGKVMIISNPNTVFTHDIYIDETPSNSADTNWTAGFKYATALFNSATLLEDMVTPIPAAVKANLRTGYSDIRVINY